MTVTPQLVKELRDRTMAGMMDCKKALEACDCDMEKAIVWLREKGIAKAEKKASRVAAEGLCSYVIDGNDCVLFELNSETDFVAKNEQFLHLLDVIEKAMLAAKPASTEEALAVETAEGTVNDLIVNATATIGEKISFRRVAVVEKADDEVFGSYMHMGGTISALAVVKGDATVAKNIAMQVASMNPVYATEADIPADAFEHEKQLQMQMMKEDPKMAGKPEKVLENILKGKVKKHFKDQCLADQEFFLDTKKSVTQYLKEEKAEVKSFVRFQVGEGMEKKEEDFAAEVAAQMNV